MNVDAKTGAIYLGIYWGVILVTWLFAKGVYSFYKKLEDGEVMDYSTGETKRLPAKEIQLKDLFKESEADKNYRKRYL